MASPKFPTQRFDQAEAALAYVTQLYDAQIAHLREALQRFVAGETFKHPVRAKYPFVRIHTDTVARADSRLSYGFVAGPGTAVDHVIFKAAINGIVAILAQNGVIVVAAIGIIGTSTAKNGIGTGATNAQASRNALERLALPPDALRTLLARP